MSTKRRKLDKENIVIELDDSQEKDHDVIISHQRLKSPVDEDDIVIITEPGPGRSKRVSFRRLPQRSMCAFPHPSRPHRHRPQDVPLGGGERTETDIKQVIAEDDNIDEETRALLLKVVAEEEEAREEELRSERLSLNLLEEERKERENS